MSYIFSKSARGYLHLRNGKPCQDFSSSYQDKERSIVTCCDGHGGDVYVRSDRGSKFASLALLSVLSRVTKKELAKADDEFLNKIKLTVLCAWNEFVESDVGYNPLKLSSYKALSDEQKYELKMNPVKAYGTTMAGALQLGDYMLLISIGDTELLGVKKGVFVPLFTDEDEPVANVTHSMCQEDAFDHIKAKVVKSRTLDGVVLCTDGLSSPYQSYGNFLYSFIRPLFAGIHKERNKEDTDLFINEIAEKLGTGDDVSLAYIISESFIKRYYETKKVL